MNKTALKGLNVLLLDDDVLLRKQISANLEKLGADVSPAGTVDAARRLVQSHSFDFAMLDVNLPDGLGTDLLKEDVFPSNTGVIIITAEGGVSGAVEAIRLGAIDYLVKPFDLAELPLVITRARRAQQSARREEHLRNSETPSSGFFFGASLASLENQLAKILASDKRMQTALPPVLIQGETGTGKTTIARLVHHHGPRAQKPLVEVNCSTLPEHLAESELFGHEKGAFTDARTARMGLFEAAHEGTLFLDELPSLPLPLQAKVLTAIEDQTIRRLGGNKQIPIDVRIIAASAEDLKSQAEKGYFREDLYHRLDLFRLSLPPLREREDDILHLAERLLVTLCKRHRLPLKKVHARGKSRLLSYRWPGNVRELAHEIERGIVFEESEELQFPYLPVPEETKETINSATGSDSSWFNSSFRFPEEGFKLEQAITFLIEHALAQSGENVSAAARLLGVSRDYIRYRLGGQKEKKEKEETRELPTQAH